MKKWSDLLKNLTLLTQLGLSLVTPLLMCIALCWWLNTKHGVGGWVYLPGFFFGLGGSGMTAWKLFQSVDKREKEKEKKKKLSFNDHK